LVIRGTDMPVFWPSASHTVKKGRSKILPVMLGELLDGPPVRPPATAHATQVDRASLAVDRVLMPDEKTTEPGPHGLAPTYVLDTKSGERVDERSKGDAGPG